METEIRGTLWRPNLRYYIQVTRPSSKFMSEWKTACVVIDREYKDEDGTPRQIALCGDSLSAHIITDALNYGIRVMEPADKQE